jgi:hypothetical protein
VQATETYRESFAWVGISHETEEQQNDGEEENKEEGKAEESKIDEMVEQLKPTADDEASADDSDEPEADCDTSVLRVCPYTT